ncbi:MAG: response regulator transcription factor [Bacteroidia bacterium]|nr:response regulator transcription factor [Bacteroidia bacterium]
MITALIIDDVANARAALRADLEDYCPNVEILGEAEGVQTGIEAVRKLKPQLIFLDIQMDDGTGFDLLEAFPAADFKVIFTTAWNEYAIKAFKFSAVDYLLKPIDGEELKGAVLRVEEELKSSPGGINLNLLMENFRKIRQDGVKKIALNTQEKIHIVNIDEIIRCESSSNYTIFYLTNNRQILVTRTLKDYENILSDHSFLRVHHSHLLNLNFLREYVKVDGGYAIMTDGQQVPVSTRKKDVLLKALSDL